MPISAWVILLLVLVLAPILLIRFRKRWVAAFNLAVTNRITSRFAARLGGFGILTHVGRKSGRVYRTPVNVFREPEGFLIALTYGRESEWVRNVVAAGAASLKLPHQPSCTIPLGDDSRFLCGSSSGSLARTISCSFRLLAHKGRVYLSYIS
jgi:F420H(2)-dependent quinone reductase